MFLCLKYILVVVYEFLNLFSYVCVVWGRVSTEHMYRGDCGCQKWVTNALQMVLSQQTWMLQIKLHSSERIALFKFIFIYNTANVKEND